VYTAAQLCQAKAPVSLSYLDQVGGHTIPRYLQALWAHAVEVVLQAAGAAPLHRRLQVLQVVLQCCLLHRLWLQWLPLLQVCRDAGLCQRTLQLCCPRHLRNAVGAAVA
jgi:hypothetical protein